MFSRLKTLFFAYWRLFSIAFSVLLLWYWFCLPNPLFEAPYSFVLEDRNGLLLGARISKDGQWRFPPPDSLPDKFIQALITFEDKRFFYHPGVDPVSLVRAFVQNLKGGKIISGGSTLNMQVIRLSRSRKGKSFFQKILEMILATRLELKYSKKEILKIYAAHAPFGGNVVGIEAASWRYFGKKPEHISWAEAAVLAVLPNSPALIHPGRNRNALKAKRDRLLDRLFTAGKIDSLSNVLAKQEPLPESVYNLPNFAPHLMDKAILDQYLIPARKRTARFRTTIDFHLQRQVNNLMEHHHRILSQNEIHNLAAVILDVEKAEILAYIGNGIGAGEVHHEEVDVVRANRSTGSILKPFLYAAALHEGFILPDALISDVPTQMFGYKPENFLKKYDGAVNAGSALVRSLNVPFVNMLQDFGLEKFHFYLKKLGLKGINKPADHYGLTLVLGGGESSLLDISTAYMGMARTMNQFYPNNGWYPVNNFKPVGYLKEVTQPEKKSRLDKLPPLFSAASIWFTFEAMRKVERPDEEGEWRRFDSSQQIAWKTGTSFGFRDGWAVGVTPGFVVGVWAGNADGEGRPGLTGVKAAAPVLFHLFDLLPHKSWFNPPYDEMVKIPVCKDSKLRSSPICPSDSVWVPLAGLKSPACDFHQLIHLDKNKNWQVNASCEAIERIERVPWFVLPPLEAHYYATSHPNYINPPPFRADCLSFVEEGHQVMQLIYPKYPTSIYVPRDLNGQLSRTVFSVAHNHPETIIYWHLDGQFIGQTQTFHSMELNPEPGKHQLVLVDEQGRRLEQNFAIIEK